jgi:long-chain acyl-CoA synthetase
VDDNPDNVAWCVDHATARLLIVESSQIAANLVNLADAQYRLPPIVVLNPDDGERLATAATFLPATGDDVVVRDLPDDTLATICFTSGTSGRPKGVMLSHGNILANVEQCRLTGMARTDDLFLSILPLSHMFERTGGYYLPLGPRREGGVLPRDRANRRRSRIAGADGHVRRTEDLRALPRTNRASLSGGAVQCENCLPSALRGAIALRPGKAAGSITSLQPCVRRIVGAPVLARLGGRLRLAVVGGAALDPELARAPSSGLACRCCRATE